MTNVIYVLKKNTHMNCETYVSLDYLNSISERHTNYLMKFRQIKQLL